MASSSDIPTPATTRSAFVTYSTLEDVLEDLSSRFILNLPDEELTSLDRVCFQVEQAHWYYEDFIREENPKFPSLPLKKFSALLFHACPHLHQWSHDHELAFTQFMQYKTRVPVCGAIMINETWEKCVLVKGWKSSSGWGFPKGKINERESPPNCAVREVLEETGYNLASQINPDDVIEMSIKEQRISLFIVQGVPEDFPFKTRTRKEISKIEWFKMTDLPTWRRNKTQVGKFYLITPFISALKNFVNQRRPRAVPRARITKSRTSQAAIEQGSDEAAPPELQDAAQESSSQSSSADNLHTPSPRYMESQVVQTNGEDDLRALADNAIDPHFARLLSSLTMSAAVKLDQPAEKKNKPESAVEVQRVLPVQEKHTLDVPNSAVSDQSSVSDQSAVSAQSVVSSSLSPRVGISRRTSSTTDISPYLPRATEVPTSAKRLKQIALLQSVAMESARKTPTLERPQTALNGVSTGSAATPAPLVANDANDLRVIYSSNGHAMASTVPTLPNVPFAIHDDPFQVRPRTTQAFHGRHQIHPGSSSMSQGALLNVINGGPRMHIQAPYQQQPPFYPIQAPLFPFQPLPLPPQHSFRRPHDPQLLSLLNNNASTGQMPL